VLTPFAGLLLVTAPDGDRFDTRSLTFIVGQVVGYQRGCI
jgi:hypothetical protein